MAAVDSKKAPTPDEETSLELGLREGSKDKKTTPEYSLEEMTDIEKSTLDSLKERNRGFWERAGRTMSYAVPFMEGENPTQFGDYKMKLRRIASERAGDIMDKMDDLSDRTTKRLRWYSLKNAKRHAEITARISVANTTLSALQKNKEIFKEQSSDNKDMSDGIRESIAGNYPWVTGVPLVRRLVLPKEKDPADALWVKHGKKLREAATEVRTEARNDKKAWDAKINERLKGERKAENGLRSTILRHNPAATDFIEEQLRACAANEPDELRKTIDALEFKGMGDKYSKEQKKLLYAAVDQLSGKSGGMAKAFELSGRLELTGTVSEILTQVRSMPIGTHLKVRLEGPDSTVRDMVIWAKRPGDRITLKPKGVADGLSISIDPKTKAIFEREDADSEEMTRAKTVAAAIEGIAKAQTTPSELTKKLVKAAQGAMMKAGASRNKVQNAVAAAHKEESKKDIPPSFLGEIAKLDKDLFPKEAYAEDPNRYKAKTYKFNDLQFSYPEHFTPTP